MPYNKVKDSDIKSFIDIVGEGHVFWGEDIHEDYTHDEMMEYGCFSPDAVVEVTSTEQVSEIMKHCRMRYIPVTPRGSGHRALRRVCAH